MEKKYKQLLSEDYRGMKIEVFKFIADGKLHWRIMRDGRLFLTDTKRADGTEFSGDRNCMNDAKFNIDRILWGDLFKYYTKEQIDEYYKQL